MTRLVGLALLFLGATASSFAGTVAAPEIDATSAIGALALLSGGLLVLRARRHKR